jgi:hypothetical protein
MTTRLSFSSALLAAALLSSACGFERREGEEASRILSPTAPSGSPSAPPSAPPAPPSSSTPAMTGVWASQNFTPPSPASCTNFQWRITSQTATSLSGDFMAECGADLTVSGSASGQLVNGTVPITVTGTASMPGIPSCSFTLNGTGTLEDNNNTLRIPFAGTTCLGPVQGTEVLRRKVSPPPAAPAPEPQPAPAPSAPGNPHHVGPGGLTEERANDVVQATAREFPHLLATFATTEQAIAATDELLLRTIWHLQQAGFNAARQRNPSGAISSDKLTINLSGAWHSYDLYSIGWAGLATTIHPFIYEVFPPNPVPDGGIPD